jgi:hypothetical protein
MSSSIYMYIWNARIPILSNYGTRIMREVEEISPKEEGDMGRDMRGDMEGDMGVLEGYLPDHVFLHIFRILCCSSLLCLIFVLKITSVLLCLSPCLSPLPFPFAFPLCLSPLPFPFAFPLAFPLPFIRYPQIASTNCTNFTGSGKSSFPNSKSE